MEDRLYKKDAQIVIYKQDPEYDCLVLHIGHIDPEIGGNYYGSWKDFQPELDSIGISETEDEWQYWGSLNRTELKSELQRRGFNVEYSEDIGYEY